MKKYYYIQAWGWLLSSFDYYVKNVISQAETENAPDNAIYKDNTGVWQTVDSITNPETLKLINTHVEYLKEGEKITFDAQF